MIYELRTARLQLRTWTDTDLAAFAALNADPEVMRHFPQLLSRQQSDAFAARIQNKMSSQGFGLWALQRLSDGAFIGFTGLAVPDFDAPFMPSVEVGWRLARSAWGHGYATEAAKQVVFFARQTLGLRELVSLTVPENVRSRGVMERLGFTRDPAEDFDHPGIAPGHNLRRHVLYRKQL